MAIVPQFDGFTRSPVRRTASICMFVFACLALSAAPVLANYEWCSRDPVLAFTRQTDLGDVSVPNLLDVQVMVPVQAASVGDAATLAVTLPSNLTYQDVDTSTPVFPIDTTFKPVLGSVSTDSYTVRLAAYVQDTSGSYPTRLMMTDPASGASVTCEGQVGHTVRATVHFAPFAVSCQQTEVSDTDGLVALP
jgi:hypothetical protein